ncbi:unnamed protein product [Closterium sp. Yama58-4]|nr:unnamed protein product [Closterium sp. Yama58-4]
MQSLTAVGASQGDVGGRRSGLAPMSATHVTTGGIAPSYGYFKFTPDRNPHLEGSHRASAGDGRADGLRRRHPTPSENNPDLRAEFRVVQLLTFTVISRCCSPGVQIALKPCRDYLDAGHQAWHFIESTYQVTDDLYIGQLEEQMTHLRMGDQETATDYCNRARRLLATMKMSGVQYSTASYVTHVLKGLPSSYNLLKRLSVVPSTRATLNEDSSTSYILRDEAMQEAERSSELLPQVNYAAPAKHSGRPGQRGQPGGGGSSGGKPGRDADKTKLAKDGGRGGGGRRRECWICHSRDHLSFECPDQSESDNDDAKGGRGRSASRRPRRESKPRKEKQSNKSTSAKDADSSASGKGRGDGEASCSLVGVMEPTVSLAPKAGENFQAVAAAVQANPAVVLLDSGCSHHLMGTKEVFVDLQPSDNIKYVRGFSGALQDIKGRGTVALQGEVGKRVLIPDVLYVPSMHANLLSAGQLKENSVELQADGNRMLLISATGNVLGRATWRGTVSPTKARTPEDALAVVHIDLCGPFRVAAKDGSLYFLLLKDRKTRYVWVKPVARKSDVLREFAQWLVLVERQAKKPVLQLQSDRGGEFLGKEFTAFMDGKGIIHDLTCPYTPQQNGMAEREMRTVVESVRTMLLHMGVQHHWWHLALRQAVWLKPKDLWGLHLGVSEESKGWELLDLADNQVVTTSDVVFYETMSLEVWKSMHGPALGRPLATSPSDTSTATLPLLAEVSERADEDAEEVVPPPVAVPHALTPTSASGDEGSSGASPVAPTTGIAGGRRDVNQVGVDAEQQAEEPMPSQGAAVGKLPTGEQRTMEPTGKLSATRMSVGEPTIGEKSAETPALVQRDAEDCEAGEAKGEQSNDGQSTDSDVVEVKPGPRRTGRIRRPPDFFVPAAFTTVYDIDDDDLAYDDAEEDEDLPELDPDMHADPEHRWDISTMTVKEALASWKGKAVKAAMDEEIQSLIANGTWQLVERPPSVNIMKNRWVLTTKYRIDNIVERKKARLVVKSFTQVYGTDYDETYAPVSSYVTLRIFLSIVAVLDLNLMQLDMKNAFLQSKLDCVLYMCQPDRTTSTTGPALNNVLVGAGWKKSQVDEALYFKVGVDKVACWVLVYVDDLLAASSSTAMLRELKELLEATFELREISPVQKYLGLEIVRDRPARKLWLHQQGYADKLRRRFIDEEQGGRTPKTPVSVDAYAKLTFDDEEAQERQEEEYRQKVGSLQFAATTTRPNIAFACSKLGSGLTVRSDQHWREVDRCLAYLANTRDTALEFGSGLGSLELVGYVDADDASDKQNRTSTGGYVFVYGGAAVSWSSQRIKCATLSSTESEYVAATEVGKEGRRLRFLLAEFRQLDAGKPTVLQVDNKSAITVAGGMGLTGNLKHME